MPQVCCSFSEFNTYGKEEAPILCFFGVPEVALRPRLPRLLGCCFYGFGARWHCQAKAACSTQESTRWVTWVVSSSAMIPRATPAQSAVDSLEAHSPLV